MTGLRFPEHSIWPTASRHLTIGWLLAVLTAPPLLAVNPNLSLDQYLHTSWTQEEGSALPPVRALAQTADGYLWLGTDKGLIRFDGMRFTEWSPASGPALPNSKISCLRPASGGGLWVGMAAGLCRVDRGRVFRYPAVDKLPCPVIASMLEDRSGRLWILKACRGVNTVALLSPDGGLQTFGTRDGLPGRPLRALFQDRQGNLWIGTDTAVCRWSPGSPSVCSKGAVLDVSSIAESGNGQLAIADDLKNQVFRFSNGQAEPVAPHIPDSAFTGAMLCDRDGNIWVGTAGQGLLRLRHGRVDRFTRGEGLSSNFVTDLVEDHEGDIWVATANGVDRIRDPKVQLYSTANGLSGDLINTVYGAEDGTIWIGTSRGLNRLAGQSITVYSPASGLPNPLVLSSYEDGAGRLWAATGAGLALQAGDRFGEVLTANGQHLKRVFNIAGNRAGAVWLADNAQGLFAVRGGAAHPVTVPGADTGDIYGLLVARNGDVWLGFYSGGITVLSSDSAKYYDSRDGLGKGPVRALYEDREGSVWAGTGNGLSRFRDARWTTWTTAQGLPEGGVQGIVEDQSGELWLLTPSGVLRLSRSNLDGPAGPLPFVLYGRTEGLRLGDSMTNPRLTRSRDGRLWVCTEDGVAAIDPARVQSNPVPPPVVIEQVIADGKTYDTISPGETAFRGHDLQVVYTGISLMVPERVRFRYRMYSLDSHWTEAGTRRNVAYMNLPPGHYRFQVIAANNDGLWNNAGAEVALRVDPYFYQTKWFALLCLTSALLLIWSVHQLKVRRVVSRLQLITAERIRFSRELHDSLLQGFAGVVYLLEAAALQFEAAPELSKQRLERAIDQADRSLREARQMIVSMRIPALENSTLPEALRSTAAQMVSGVPVDFQFELKGRVHQGPYDVEGNLFLMAREAVTNCLNHAAATRIRLELCYTPKELHMTIEDDGRGFDPEMALAKPDHYGFRGMHERARHIGAVLTVDSAPGSGTKIEATVIWKKR
jgi:ligand-binding sensor domain-containing protein/signal transduction histidine kinase